MNEIKLSVEDKNIDTVLTILNNIKNGLIYEMQTTSNSKANTSYTPKNNKVILEENSSTSNLRGKYINPAAYKKRVQKLK